MSAEPLNNDAEHIDSAKSSDGEAGQRAFKEALAITERLVADAARMAEKAFNDGVAALRAQTKAYSGPASQTVDDAQRYVIERVKERPVTAALAGLGVGFLLGVLLSGRGK